MKTRNLIQTVALVATFASAPIAAYAVDRAWTNALSGFWGEPDRWSPPGVPDPADNLTFSGSSAYIYPAFTISNRLTWTSGHFANSLLTVASGGVLEIRDDTYKSFCGVITNAGWVQFNASGSAGRRLGLVGTCGFNPPGFINQAGAVFEFLGDLTVYGMGGYGTTAFFTNAGTVRKSGGSGVAKMGDVSPVAFHNQGVVEVRSGTLEFARYSNSPTANLVVSLGGATTNDYACMAFLNAPTFLGQFTVTTRNGYRPSPGDVFEVLRYPSATVNFTCLNGLDLGGGILLLPTFAPTNLTLTTTTYTVTDRPQLFISRSPGAVRLVWPLGFPGWRLVATTNLTTPVWEQLPVQCGNEAVVPRSAVEQYFRLAQ